MVEVLSALLTASAIIFFGVFAEFLFKKLRIPDVLFLIAFGLILGNYGLGYVNPSSLITIAPVFTAFALLFLLFEGSFNIDLVSFFKGLGRGMTVTFYNFAICSAATAAIAVLSGFSFMSALLLGFILGGTSSAFVIPVIKSLGIRKETYSVLALESAVTDVLCIVFAITVMQIIALNNFSLYFITSRIASLFAIAGFFGVSAGLLWIFVVHKLFRKHKPYMLVIALLLFLYAATEYMNGNGAIAALFFGLVLRNSKKLSSLISKANAVEATSRTEKLFNAQISFFLKTFFFVYIGALLDFSNIKALAIGALIAAAVMMLRLTNSMLTRDMTPFDRAVISSIFARGLAAAVLAQLAIQKGIEGADLMSKIVFSTIMFTIVLSSARIFYSVKKHGEGKAAGADKG